MKRASQIIAVLVLVLGLASAQDSRVYQEGNGWVQETTGSLTAARNLRVRVDMGGVRVVGSGQSNITYNVHSRVNTGSESDARRQLQGFKISAFVRGDTAWITGEWEGSRPRRFSGEFNIQVPRGMELVKVETEGGSVSAAQLDGRVEAETGGGSIHADDIGGPLRAETGGGSIDVGKTTGDVEVHTGGGGITIHSVGGRLVAATGGGSVTLISGSKGAEVETGGGNIQVERCGGELKASTGGGSLEVGNLDGPAILETGGGSIHLSSAKGVVKASTGGGSIELNGVPAAHAETGGGGIMARFVASGGQQSDSILETSVGDITVYLDPRINLTIRASIEAAHGHKIRTDFSEIHVSSEGGEWEPQTVTADGTLNGGGPVLKIRTTAGDVSIRRAQ